MRKIKFLLVFAVVLALLVGCGCASIAEKWGDLTPTEKSRLILGDLQDQLISLKRTGDAYCVIHPEALSEYQAKVLPAISVANKMIKSAILVAATDPVTPAQIYASIVPVINAVSDLLVRLGVIKSSAKGVMAWIPQRGF